MNNDLFWIDTNQALIYEYIEKQTLLSHLDNELKRIKQEHNAARINFNNIIDRYTENLRKQNGIPNI
jgi:tyrosyl-tRNA synthetase